MSISNIFSKIINPYFFRVNFINLFFVIFHNLFLNKNMFSKLYNLYWFIRMTRNNSKKRSYYRHVYKERIRLIESGVDHEELRLLCRHLSNLRNSHAEKRLEDYRSKF